MQAKDLQDASASKSDGDDIRLEAGREIKSNTIQEDSSRGERGKQQTEEEDGGKGEETLEEAGVTQVRGDERDTAEDDNPDVTNSIIDSNMVEVNIARIANAVQVTI